MKIPQLSTPSALVIAIALVSLPFFLSQSQDSLTLPIVSQVESQPLLAQTKRLIEALDHVGRPLSSDEKAAIEQASLSDDETEARGTIQRILDPHCIAMVVINPESRVKAQQGPADLKLIEKGWTSVLVKVHNEAGVTAALEVKSPQAQPLHGSPQSDVRDRWLDLAVFKERPLNPTLSGLELEYRILQLYSRDAGKRSAVLEFSVGQGTQDLGFRSDLMLTFDAAPAHEVFFEIKDEHGEPTTAGLEIRDAMGRVYPAMTKRLAPDFSFHPQIYRHSGESVKLPAGSYELLCTRGPEYLRQTRELEVTQSGQQVTLELERWIDPAEMGWWSGDHHIHAAGCAHYSNPTEGVHAPDMMRHCMGEDLKIGANLTWGPCFDYQKQFFTGVDDDVSQYPYLLRYDVEVSGFGSHESGHLCLLRLKEQMYPGGNSTQHWPTLGLNTLKWAQKQGAVSGPAHSGWGLQLPDDNLPNYNIPPFDGIGACEYIVDVTHMVEGPNGTTVPAVDFMSTVDTPYPWELNIWYHTLNVGYRTRISGETDFPCIYGERVGLGRSYVKLDGDLDYDQWCQGIADGRNYVSDGKSHLIDFTVNGLEMGTEGSELSLSESGTITATVKAAALLNTEPNPSIRDRAVDQQPYWHIERARIDDSREVKVELIVNGSPVAEQTLTANGDLQDLTFQTEITQSSWVALRILPSSHTNPVFVLVEDQPIRASKQSAEWCLKSVDQLWSQKERFIAEAEMDEAKAAYEHARVEYRRILEESSAE